MKVLAHIHAFNDEAIIDLSIQAVTSQSRQPDGFLLVDNGSSDGTLEREFPDCLEIIRHEKNSGTSGAVRTGMQYAIENGFDWIWILDADSAPRTDSLEKLLEHYLQLEPAEQERVALMSSLPVDTASGMPFYGIRYTDWGFEEIPPPEDSTFGRIQGAIWSGCLYKIAAVESLGLPTPDYMLDWAEYQYGYLAIQRGYSAYMCYDSIIDHNIEGAPALHYTQYKLGPLSLSFKELPPIRCYYFMRNTTYFWLWEFEARSWRTLLFYCLLITRFSYGYILRFFIRPHQFVACMKGLWFGLRGDISRQYSQG